MTPIDELKTKMCQQVASHSQGCTEEAQQEIGALLALLEVLNQDSDLFAAQSLDATLAGLLLPKPNILMSRTVRRELEYRLRKRLHPFRVLFLGGSSAAFVLLGLATILPLAVIAIFPNHPIWATIWEYLGFGPQENVVTLVGMSGGVGSVFSILLRVQTFAEVLDGEGWRGDPWALYLTGLTKPVIGVFSAWFVFALYKIGFIPVKITGEELYWYGVLGFLSGFSERLVADMSAAATKRITIESRRP